MQGKLKLLAAVLSLSVSGFLFTQQSEDIKKDAYIDATGTPTICSGHTKGVTLGMRATLKQCEEYLKEDTSIAGKAVSRLVKVPITQEQYDMLVDFTVNCGAGNLARSTLLAKLNNGDFCGAGHEFGKWNKSKGKVLRGLTIRRAKNAAPFIEECK